MGEALAAMQVSMKQASKQLAGQNVEDDVDSLIKKLEGQGKRVKILPDGAAAAGENVKEESGAEKRRLEEQARRADADKERIAEELQRREREIARAASEREGLEEVIKEMERRLVGGGQALEDKQREQAKAYKEYQQRLKAEQKKQKQLREEQRKKEEEVLSVTRQYKDLQEEVNENRKVIGKLKELYSRSQQEIKDLKEEQQGDRDDLLHTVRTQGYELKFFRRLVQMLMREDEIARLRHKSEYDDNADDWLVPPFLLRAKEITLPQLRKGYDVMEQEKENRELAIDGGEEAADSEDEEEESSSGPPRRNEGGLFSGQKNGHFAGGVRTSQHKVHAAAAAMDVQRRADNMSQVAGGGMQP